MNCSCLDSSATSYERLPSVSSLFELGSLCRDGDRSKDPEEKDVSNEKEEELVFFNDDGSYQAVVVERNLRSTDLCQLLALKNRVSKDVNWSIVEHWLELGLERSVEDHEDILSVYHDMETFGKYTEKRFVFRKDFRKYEFFRNPQQFFPADMVDLNGYEELLAGDCSELGKTVALQTLLATAEDCPPIFSHVWVREPNKQVWRKAFLLLRDKTLFLSYKVQIVAKFLRNWKSKDSGSSNKEKVYDGGNGQLQVLAHLCEHNIYTTLNAKNQFRAPTEFGICLRPTSPDNEESGALRCLACESERARLCWVTAMRLAKYGKQLRENYRAFKNKQTESLSSSPSPKEYNSYHVPTESVRSRVAMDFTGSVGRIVEDPKEAKAIAVAEGYAWKRRWRPSARQGAANILHIQGIESGVHITQPWFHSGMSREQATQLINRYGTVDGVFLVRESRSSAGAFVLTFKCSAKVIHTQIQPVMDPIREALCYSLDNGVTKFYDLLQLVEFYQLNAGCLPTRLTHYVVQSSGPVFSPDKQVAASF